MKARIVTFYHRSIRNKLLIILPLTTALFLLFPSVLSIFALRKQSLDYIQEVGGSFTSIQNLFLTQTVTLVLIGLLAIAALATLVSLIAYGITHPLTELAKETEKMARGQRDLKPLPFESSDEVGTLAQSINHFIATIDKMEKEKERDAALTAIGRMSAELAHEIRNPLGSIDIFCQLFSEQWNQEKFRQSFSKTVPYELDRIKTLVNGLLEVARPVHLEFKRVDVKKVLNTAVVEYQNGAYPHLKVRLEIDKGIEAIEADEFALLRVFKNLIQNAVQAMDAKGTLTLTLQKMFDENTQSEKVEFKIQDTGPGMDNETLNRVFEPFFTKKKGGTGLGLAICRKIVMGHGGKILAQSQPGLGTTFAVELPMVTDTPPAFH